MSNLFDIKMVFTQIPDLLTYLPVTLELAVVSMIVSLILGLILALIKMKKIPVLKQIANLYISVIRGTPVLVQLYVTYFGIPMILKAINLKYGTNYNANGVAPIIYAFIALAVNESAYNAEVIRASLESVPKGQIEAANALGMTYFQALRRVILPEAIVVALPSLGKKRLRDYDNLWAYARDLYQTPGFGDTTDFAAIKKHYHIDCNPGNIHQIIAKGPDEEAWLLPHGREKLSEK